MKIPTVGSLVTHFKSLLNSPVVANILTIGVVTFGIKLIGFYKETLVASTFGLSLLLDTFIVAVIIPNFIQNIFIGALNKIFIPNYIAEQTTSNALGAFQSIIFLVVASVMLFFTVLTYLSSNVFVELVFPNKGPEYYELTRSQLRIVLPSLFFMGFSSVIRGLLQIKGKFFITSIVGIIPAISTIIALLFFQENLGEMVLAYGFLFGSSLPFFFLLYLGYRYEVIHLKKPQLNVNSRIMFKQLPAKLTSGILSGLNPLIDKYFAGQLIVGSLAAINYSQKIPFFSTSVVLTAIATVVLPYFSKLGNTNQVNAFNYLFRMLKTLFFTTLIGVIVLVVFSETIVSILFERGEFDSNDTEIVANLQRILLIYIPFAICQNLMVNFLTSINKNSFMAYVSLIKVILNIIFNLIFIKKYGLYGLVLSTTFVEIISTLVFYSYVKRLFKLSIK